MKTIQQVNSEKLCLLVTTQRSLMTLVLYKGTDINNIVIIGVLSATSSKIEKCGMYQVETVAAEQNYGPLMYDLILSYTEQPLMADTDSVKPAARSIWNHMFEDESKYVMVKKSNPLDCQSYVKNSGLMNQYGIKIKQPIDYSVLQRNHKQVLAKVLNNKQTTEREFIKLLVDKSDKYFLNKYNPGEPE